MTRCSNDVEMISQPSEAITAIAGVSRHDDVIAIGPMLPEDIGSLYLWLNDVEAAKSNAPYKPVDAAMLKAWIEHDMQSDSECLFAVRRLSEQNAIGYVQLRNVHPIHHSAELGIRIGRECDRGKGYGTRAVRLVVDYAFDTLNLNRVFLTVPSNNHRAVAAYRAANFRDEGVQRQASFLNGAWTDMLMMAVLRSDAAMKA